MLPKSTRKPAHTLRDLTGRYSRTLLCDACNKPAGTDPLCDDEVCHGDQTPGFTLCERKRCRARLENLSPEERLAIYEETVAKRNGRPAVARRNADGWNTAVEEKIAASLDELLAVSDDLLSKRRIIYQAWREGDWEWLRELGVLSQRDLSSIAAMPPRQPLDPELPR